MMYQEKLAVAIKHNGKVLRESGDTIFIPFGSEYSIFVKNMNSVRALVRISIDGTDVTENMQLVVKANDSVEIERFVKGGNLEGGLKFKFIERTAKIEDGPRGIKVEDGLIRVEFEFEREPAKIKYPDTIVTTWPPQPSPYWVYPHRPWHDRWGRPILYGEAYTLNASSPAAGEQVTASSAYMNNVSSNAVMDSAPIASATNTMSDSREASAQYNARGMSSGLRSAKMSKSLGAAAAPMFDSGAQERERGITQASVNEAGITVGGSKSNQEFSMVSGFATDGVKHVLIIKILGETKSGRKVEKAVTVKTKNVCPTCGTVNKFGVKFCKECGTGLEIV